jgi:hypothetical protein
MKIVRRIILATPLIAKGMLQNVLDKRVALREMQETEAVELTASTAMHPVNLEAKGGLILLTWLLIWKEHWLFVKRSALVTLRPHSPFLHIEFKYPCQKKIQAI